MEHDGTLTPFPVGISRAWHVTLVGMSATDVGRTMQLDDDTSVILENIVMHTQMPFCPFNPILGGL